MDWCIRPSFNDSNSIKNHISQSSPKIIEYRDYKNFIQKDFHKELKAKLRTDRGNYVNFEENFLDVLNRHAPIKKKVG